jgi:tetratricopeptide (TPR) repeat protein
VPLGRVDEALRQLRLAQVTDPFSEEVQFQLGWLLISAGRYAEAAARCQKLSLGHPSRTKCLARAMLFQGRTDEAIQLLESSSNKSDRSDLGYAYARLGRRSEAEKLAIDVAARPLQQADIFAGLGDKDRTLEALNRNGVVGPVRTAWILSSPEFALLRGDPRVRLLRAKVGLPD